MILNDTILNIAQIVFCIGLFILAGISEKYPNSKWKLVYLAPALICVILIAVTGTDSCMVTTYIGSALLLSGFFMKKKLFKRISAVLSAWLTLASIVVCISNPAYRGVDYYANFKKGFTAMKERYLLTEYKQIDWDMLYDKYEPIFADITEESDNIFAWNMFCAEFHDGHVFYMADDSNLESETMKSHYGKDYGLVILNYDDGRAVAVDVDESLNELGIYNGTIIKTWNGLSTEECAELSDGTKVTTYPEKDNEYFYRSLYSAGTGSGSAEVVFIDDNGNEQTATLKPIGKFSDRLSDFDEKLNNGMKAANMSWNEINDTTACLRIKMMMFDTSSYMNDDYSEMKDEIRQQILELKQQGIKDVIIDIRNNGGGSGTLIMAIAELFAPYGEHFYCYDGVWDNTTNKYKKNADGTFVLGEKNTFMGENILGDDAKIVVLVNSGSVSASEHLTKVMSSFDNTTIMGFTKTVGSAQGITSIDLATGTLTASASAVLNDNGTVFIDSDAERHSDCPLDIKIPFNENAVRTIFYNNEDYLMQKAEEFLDR